MPKRAMDFETVRELARELGGIDEPAGTPALKAGGKLLAWIPPHKSVEPGSLAVSIDFERRAEFVEAAPEIYYFTGHYRNYPTVLVRLARIPRDALKDLLAAARSFVAAKPSRATGNPRKKRIARRS